MDYFLRFVGAVSIGFCIGFFLIGPAIQWWWFF